MTALPEDILRNIFSFATQATLLSCRLTNRATGSLATASAFHHVRLEAARDSLSFLRVSESVQLRGEVREITIDACSNLETPRDDKQNLFFYTRFLLSLPRLRCFSGLQVLNIRFLSELPVPPFVQFPEEVWPVQEYHRGFLEFHSRLLITIAQCLAGEWTENEQLGWEAHWLGRLDEEAQLGEAAIDRTALADFLEPTGCSQPPIALSALTVSNLPEILDERLHTIPAFRTMFSARALKLLVAPREHPLQSEETIHSPEKYEFFEKMPSTWLAPPIATNLRELSLHCQNYFGWAPKFDFRKVNPSCGYSSGFPNLRVLALGQYVFSHQWQVDWVASLGRENGRGGLEELYLGYCPIMWRAHIPSPMDESLVNVGDGHILDNRGYPLKEVLTHQDPYEEEWEPIKVNFDLRWSSVLREWKEKMQSLKVFKMGGANTSGLASEMVAMTKALDLPDHVQQNPEEIGRWKRREQRRTEDTSHLNYDKPSVQECLEHGGFGLLKHGVGLKQEREYLLPYILFNINFGPTPWIKGDFKNHTTDEFEDGWQRYEGSQASDEQALSELMDVIASRT